MLGLIAWLAMIVQQAAWFVAMVKSSAFPPPLSAAEERECVRLTQQGDADARRRLISHNVRLVAHVVKRFSGQKTSIEDLISIGTIGLIKAIDSYTADKGTKLATFAARCIENEVLMHLRSGKKSKNDVSLHEPLGTDGEGNEVTLMDIVSTPAEAIADEVHAHEEHARVHAHLAALDAREQTVIRGRFALPPFVREQTQRDLALQLGISRSYVSRIEKRALLKLYRALHRKRQG
jgi:RNA polymerase sporulation-specific sigma factor